MALRKLCFLTYSHQTWAVCPGDLDESGTVEVGDVLGLLSMFGCELDCGGADLDADGAVGSSDVLLVLGYFGQSCEANGPSVWTNPTFEVLFEDNVVYGSGLSHDGWGGPVLDTISLELDVYAPDNQEEGRPALVIIHGEVFLEAAMNKELLLICRTNTPLEAGLFFSINYRLAAQRYSPAVLVERSSIFAGRLQPRCDSACDVSCKQRRKGCVALGDKPRRKSMALMWTMCQSWADRPGLSWPSPWGASNEEDYLAELSVFQDPTLSSTNLGESFEVQAVLDFWGGRASVDALTALDEVQRFDSGDAPLMIVHGTADPTVDYSEATSLNATYDANGNPSLCIPLKTAVMGFGGYRSTDFIVVIGL